MSIISWLLLGYLAVSIVAYLYVRSNFLEYYPEHQGKVFVFAASILRNYKNRSVQLKIQEDMFNKTGRWITLKNVDSFLEKFISYFLYPIVALLVDILLVGGLWWVFFAVYIYYVLLGNGDSEEESGEQED